MQKTIACGLHGYEYEALAVPLYYSTKAAPRLLMQPLYKKINTEIHADTYKYLYKPSVDRLPPRTCHHLSSNLPKS